LLEVRNLEVVYEDVILVLKGVSIEVPENTIVALLGANGAGKTTTLRAITSLLGVHRGEITKGHVLLDGERIDHLSTDAIVKKGLSQVLEGRRVFAELTVDENLKAGSFTDMSNLSEKFDRVFSLFPILADRRNRRAGYLSGGEQQMLAIGRALMTNPRYLMMDEPSLGLAPRLVEQIRDLIVQINEQGTAVLLVEQNANMALRIAKHGYILENGKVVMDKPAAELREDEDVKEFYLGLRKEGEFASFRDVKHYKRRKRWLS
jgi:branched-chain amino acid transport system ATP-binding protein